jgi:hypothetical protein
LVPQLLNRDSIELLEKVLRHLLQMVHEGTAFLDPCRSGKVFDLGSEAACLRGKRADHAAKLMSSLAQARKLAIPKGILECAHIVWQPALKCVAEFRKDIAIFAACR